MPSEKELQEFVGHEDKYRDAQEYVRVMEAFRAGYKLAEHKYKMRKVI